MMNNQTPTYKVYVRIDIKGNITAVDSSVFLSDTAEWIQIDEGAGDKYAHAQGNYLDKPLYDSNGCANYKLVDGKVMERTEEEKQTNSTYIEKIRQNKLNEVSGTCEQVIYSGIDVKTSKGTEHFSLTLNDQTNMSALASAIVQGGAMLVPYHADGQLCRDFTAEEFMSIFSAVKSFIAQQTTLCNHLNVWIRRCKTADEINSITYDSKLPDDLLTNYKAILETNDTAHSVIPN